MRQPLKLPQIYFRISQLVAVLVENKKEELLAVEVLSRQHPKGMYAFIDTPDATHLVTTVV